jgi:hypothetical protein
MHIPLGHFELEKDGEKVPQSCFHVWRQPMVRISTALDRVKQLTVARKILFFPYGNNCECASLYLEQGYTDKPPEDWYKCVQFGLVLWNPNDPTHFVHHRTHLQIERSLDGEIF